MSSAARPAYPALADPARPAWHFGPPAQWMNDPNGPLWHDGWCHLFYQHNPTGEVWADIHWGHARSRDLVHWEHLPLALRPQRALGEGHCYSGSTALDAGGTPRILYTSVAHDPVGAGNQVIASPTDAGLLGWTQDVAAPFLDLATHDGPDFGREWRDPFVFRAEGRTFLILGARLGDESVIPLYENPDGHLRRWTSRGILHRAPVKETVFFECPNLVRLREKWLLLTSPVREVEWCSGTLDLAAYAFHVERRGRVDESDSYYATQTLLEPSGRTVLFAWVQRFPQNRGWNGRLGAPRRIWLDAAGDLCAEPIAELAVLRGAAARFTPQSLGPAGITLALPGDASHEAELTLSRDPAATVRLEVAGVTILLGPEGVQFDGRPVKRLPDGATARVHWLLDRSLLEIFVDHHACYTRVVPFPPSSTARLASTGSARLDTGRAWPLQSC